MNCVEFQEIVHDLARDAGVDQKARQDALAHADSCPRCDGLLAEAQSLTGALRSLAAKDAAAGASQETELALLNAFRQQRVRTPRLRFTWQWAFAGAAGIAALLLFSVLVLRRSEVRLPTSGTTAVSSTTAQSSTPEAAGQTQPPAASDTSSVSGNENSEYADSFVTLPFAEDVSPAVDEVIIRQPVSRAALANLGLPISEADPGENLLADFVVDENGTPRAVRIVE